MVNFYADWCHFCRQLSPIYDTIGQNFAEDTDKKLLALTKVDSVAEPELNEKYNINKYPTLKIFIYGIERKPEYRGDRSIQSLSSFLNSIKEVQYKIIPYADSGINDMHTSGDEVAFVAILKKQNVNGLKTFDKVSRIYGGTAKFYLAYSSSNVKETIYYKADDVLKGEKALSGSSDHDLLEWVKNLAIPFVRELTFQNAEEITEEGKPLLVLFYDTNDISSRDKFRAMVKDKLSHVDSVIFLTGEGQTFIHPLKHLGKNLSDLPLLVMDSFQHMYIFKEPIETALRDSAKVEQFIKDLHSGKLHREYHYGPDPTVTSHPTDSVFKKLAPNADRYSIKDEF